MRIGAFVAAGLLAIVGAVGGCAKPAKDVAPVAALDPQIADAAANVRGVIIRRGDGSGATWEEMVADASGADVVLVGELHGQPVGQAFEAALFEDVLARSPKVIGALEFFERDEQAGLDDYLTGVTDEEAMKKATRRAEGNYPSGHRAIIELSKAAGRPVVAANSPRSYVKLARTEGFERLASLTAEQKRLFVVPSSLPTGKYRDDFFELMRGGKKAGEDPALEERVEAMFRSQSVWDATMADSVAKAVDAGGKPVVLVVGKFHIDFEGGLVQAFKRQTMAPVGFAKRIVTVSFVGDWAEASGMNVADRGRADYLVYVGPAGE